MHPISDELEEKLDKIGRLFPSLSSRVANLKNHLSLLHAIMPYRLRKEFLFLKDTESRIELMVKRIEGTECRPSTPETTMDNLIADCMLNFEDMKLVTKPLLAFHLEIDHYTDYWVSSLVIDLLKVQMDSNKDAVTSVQNLKAYRDLSKHLAKVCESKAALVKEIWKRVRAVVDQTTMFLYSCLYEQDTDLNLMLTRLLEMTDPTHPIASEFYFKIFNSMGFFHQIPFPDTDEMNFINYLLLVLKNQIIHCQECKDKLVFPSSLEDQLEKLIVFETLVKATVSYSPLSLHNMSTDSKIILYGGILKHATTVLSFSFSKDSEESNLDESFDKFVSKLIKSGFVSQLLHNDGKSIMIHYDQLEKFSEYMNFLRAAIVSESALEYWFSKVILQKFIVKLVVIVPSSSSIDTEEVEDNTRKEKNLVLPAKFDVPNLIDKYKKSMEDVIYYENSTWVVNYLTKHATISKYINGLEKVQKKYLSSNKQAIISIQNLKAYQNLIKQLAKRHVFKNEKKIWKRAREIADHTAKLMYSCLYEQDTDLNLKLTHLLQMTDPTHPVASAAYFEIFNSMGFSHQIPFPDTEGMNFIGHLLHKESVKGRLEEFSVYTTLLKDIFSYQFGKILFHKVIDTIEVEADKWKEKKLALPAEFDVPNLIYEYEKFMVDAGEIHDFGEYIDCLEEVQKQYLSSNKQAIISVQNLRSFQHLIKVMVNWYKNEDLLKNHKSQLLVAAEHTTIFLCSCWMEPEKNQELKLTRLLQMTTIKNAKVQSIYVHGFKTLEESVYSPWPNELAEASFIDHMLLYLKELIQCQTRSLVASSKEQLENLHRYLIVLRNTVSVKDIVPSSQHQYIIPSRMRDFHSLVIKFVLKMAKISITDSEDAEEENLALLHDLEENVTLMKTEFRKSFIFDCPSIGFEFFFFLENLEEISTLRSDVIAPMKHQFDMVYTDLLKLRSFLDKIKDKSTENKEQVKDLRRRIAQISHMIEVHIQSYVNRDARYGPTFYHALQLPVVIEDIQLLITEIEGHDTDDSNYGTAEKTYEQGSSRGSTPNITDMVVGFEDEMQAILENLIGRSESRNIVAIVGMPGLGKTTIAKKVYNHPSAARQFQLRAWCSVSQSYKKKELLLQILRSITKVDDDQILEKSDVEIAATLSKCLKKLRYLIVLDDVWETKVWENLKRSFPDDNNQSRVIITSRNHDVAQTLIQSTPYNYLHPLRVFNDKESFKLLQQKLFPHDRFPNDLSDPAKMIAQQCRGLPLAVVLAAGILSRMEKNKDRWVRFGESLSSQIVNEPGNQCKNLIELSYTHLPDHLKCCFLYFGAFPEDKEISARKLSWLWIAEGFVRDANAERLEDIAEHYLMDLIGRSLVIGSMSVSRPGIKSCHVHDLLRDFCLVKAEEEKFLQVVRGYKKYLPPDTGHVANGDDPQDPQDRSNVTHLQYRLSVYSKRKHFIRAKPSGPNVRTLFFHALADMYQNSPYDTSFISRYFKLIKVLDLGSINIGDSLAGVALMLHLRFLAVKGDVDSVPTTIENLRNLETFILRGLRVQVISVPNSIWRLLRLRHLHIEDHISINLDSEGTAISTVLTDMESFSTPTISYGDEVEELLRRLPNLRKLKCIFLGSWDDSEKCNRFPVLEFLTKLVSLKVSLSYKMFHSSHQCPCRFSFPSNLTKLTLSEFGLPWSEISAIGKLPNLNSLKLLSRAFTGKRWDMSEGDFLALKFLKLESLDIKIWIATKEHIPCLQRLMLSKCERLKEIPSEIGDIDTLEIIEVRWCTPSAANSARIIQETADEYGDDKLKVHIYPNEEYPSASS